MPFLLKFTKLMKSEPKRKRKIGNLWVMDESKCLSAEEIRKLRQHCKNERELGIQEKKFSKVRNWFMIELALNAGLRVEEMASLKHKNLLLDGARSSILVTGKGEKRRAVWISTKFKDECLEYIKYKRDFAYPTDEDSYLLNNLKGTKITKRALQKFFKNILRETNLPPHYYIHCLRHTYSTFFLKASQNNYRFLQNQLGHSSMTTTQVYAAVVESEGRRALENLFK